MNIKDYIDITADSVYIREVSGIKYSLNTDNMTRPKGKDKAQIESQAEIISEYKTLSKT